MPWSVRDVNWKCCTWNDIESIFLILTIPKTGSSAGKESACSAGNLGLIPGMGRSPAEGSDYPFQYSCLENSMDSGAWQVTVHGVTNSQTWLSDFHSHFSFTYTGIHRHTSCEWALIPTKYHLTTC